MKKGREVLINSSIVVAIILFAGILFYNSQGEILFSPNGFLDKVITQDSQFSIDKSFSGFKITGEVNLNSENSLVRVTLIDSNGKEYLVYEAYPLISENNVKLTSACEETCNLNLQSARLKIKIVGASIKINSISPIAKGATIPSKTAAEKMKAEKEKLKIDKMNQQIKAKGLTWVAGETSVSKLSYEEKKKLFAYPNGTPVAELPNLQGFEYYEGGIFEIKSEKDFSDVQTVQMSPSDSNLPTSWDWRNVNGENWMTSVKNQGNAGNCWAFANIGALESQINLYYNKKVDVDLSEQMLVDCANLGPIAELSGYPEQCGGDNMCYPGANYCKDVYLGIADENSDPYSQRELIYNPSVCDESHIASDWRNRLWKISDFHDYKFLSAFVTNPTPGCANQTLNLSEVEFKKILITKGPLDSVINQWHHAMVLLGYHKITRGDIIYSGGYAGGTAPIIIGSGDPLIGQTCWVFKNSWGTNWGDNGYGKIVSFEDIGWGSLPMGPFIPPIDKNYWPAGFDGKVNCVDKDKDNYCNWGISEQPPTETICPATCKKDSQNKLIKDCDDSNPTIGPFDANYNCVSLGFNKYDFNCDHSTNVNDINIISNLWKSGTIIDINLVTAKAKQCKPLGEYFGSLWRQGFKTIPIREVTRIAREIQAIKN